MLLGFTILWLCIYFPLETWASVIGGGLLSPAYLIDLVGMALLAWGVTGVRRRRPFGFGILAAGWAWTAANFWRGTMERFWANSQGMELQFGSPELLIGPILTAATIGALIASLVAGHRQSVDATKR